MWQDIEILPLRAFHLKGNVLHALCLIFPKRPMTVVV